MLRKLTVAWVLILTLAFSSISIYATDEIPAQSGTEGGITTEEPEGTATDEPEGTATDELEVTEEEVTEGAISVTIPDEEVAVTDPEVNDTITPDDDGTSEDKEPVMTKKQKAALKYKKGLAAFIRKENKKISKATALKYAEYFIRYGERYNIDEKLVMAMADRESNFNVKSYNPAGYYGMLQLNAGIARKNGYKTSSLFKAWVNIKCGTRYLSDLIRIMGSRNKGIASYMYGSGNVSRGYYSMVPVNKILAKRDAIKSYLKKYDYV